MALLVTIDYNTAVKYRGKSVSTIIDGKKQKVYFILLCDDMSLVESISLASSSKNILMVEYQGLPNSQTYRELETNSGVYVGRVYDCGCNITEEDIIGILDEVPEPVKPILHMPKDFSDLKFVWRMCSKYPRVRFSGGNLFNISGTRLGRVGLDTIASEKIKISMDCYRFNGNMDIMNVISADDIELEATGKLESSGTKKRSSSSISAPKKVGKTAMFSDLLGLKDVVLP